jgi:hypothetical protein
VSLSGIDLPSASLRENMLRGYAAQASDCISSLSPSAKVGGDVRPGRLGPGPAAS